MTSYQINNFEHYKYNGSTSCSELLRTARIYLFKSLKPSILLTLGYLINVAPKLFSGRFTHFSFPIFLTPEEFPKRSSAKYLF